MTLPKRRVQKAAVLRQLQRARALLTAAEKLKQKATQLEDRAAALERRAERLHDRAESMQPRIDKSMQKLDEKLCCTPLEGKTYIDYDSEELRDATPHECFQGELSDLIGPWEHISAEQLDEAIRYVERNYA